MFLEVAYECIVDAGYNPKELRGSNTGKFSYNSIVRSSGNFSSKKRKVTFPRIIELISSLFILTSLKYTYCIYREQKYKVFIKVLKF